METKERNRLIDLVLRRTTQSLNTDTLEARLKSGKKMVVKFGADPSRPDLHLGHSVCIRALKALQDLGHEIVFVIGDFTAMIGDPSGKSTTRPSLTFEETRKSGQTYFKQVTKILDPEKTRITYNSEWLGKLSFEDVIKLAGKYTVARILERNDFSKRFKEHAPIGIHEILYPLVQAYDSIALNADIEVGGTDQTFNLLVGRDLQKSYDQEPQDIMVFPLLVGIDGKEKMSKSLDNYIGIDESPEVMYEKAMKIPDSVLLEYFRLTTDLDTGTVTKLIEENIVKAHIEYAREIIRMYHGEEYIPKAEKRYKDIASGGVPEKIETFDLSRNRLNSPLSELLVLSGLVKSKSEGRRMIKQNGISVNDVKISDVEMSVTSNLFSDGEIIIKKGKRDFRRIVLV